MDILVMVLIEWLTVTTGMSVNAPVEVVIMEEHTLNAIVGAPVEGMYKNSIIFLSDTVDLSTIKGQSVLLHELVHHFQNTNGLMSDYGCIREAEQLAYELQRDFLIRMGETPDIRFGQFNIILRSMCREYL